MRLIPKALAYAKNVNAVENNSFQAWLQEKVDREDLIWWARKEEVRELREDTESLVTLQWKKQIKSLIP